MPLDYTNVIGKDFSPYVVAQLAKRTELVSKLDRTTSDLMWLTNRSGWVKITSNVDVKEGNPIATKYGAGSGLAQKYILQGGVMYATAAANNGSVLRSGVGVDKAYGIGLNPSVPGTDMGFKPMPGITSFGISADGPYGALRTANIKIKAFNLEQFNIIETLYCHLGYSLIIEFGHIPYINNDGVLKTNIQTLDAFKLTSKEQVTQNISSLRSKTCGNYDGMFGTVTNYSWTTSNDGSFDIDLKVIGPGTLVESLTINYTTSVTTNPLTPTKLPIYKEFQEKKAEQQNNDSSNSAAASTDTSASEKSFLPGVIASRNNSNLHRHLYSLYENALTTQQVTNTGDGGAGALRTTTTPTLTGQIFSQNQSYPFLNVSTGGITGDYVSIRGNNSWVIANGKAGDVPVISGDLFRYFNIAFITSPKISSVGATEKTKDQLPSVYIPFGYMLAILQSAGMLYNTNSSNDSKAARPIIYLDFNNKTNLCYAEDYAVSVDPTKCLINIANGQKLNDTLFNGLGPKDEDGKVILPATNAQIKEESKYVPDNDLLSKSIVGANLGYYNTGNSAYLMNVLLNVEFIVATLDALVDERKEVKLDKFLNEILKGINESTGGINEFRVSFEDESFCVRLLDEQKLNDNTGEIKYGVIDVLGLGSIVHNYSFASKITPKLGQMLIISAQADAGKKQAAQDASAIGTWNQYVKDRIVPNKVDSVALGESGEQNTAPPAPAEGEGQPESPDDQLSRHIKGIYEKFNYSADDIEAAKATLKEKYTKIKANSEPTKASQMIPLEMSIKMDGLSGILVNQTFMVPPQRLPLSYRPPDGGDKTNVAFIVRKIENSIENNKWYTNISGQSIHLGKDVSVKTVKVDVGKNPLAGLPATSKSTSSQPKAMTDPTEQKKAMEEIAKTTVNNNGINYTTSATVWIPKNATKEAPVVIFYPGVEVNGNIGKQYMPSLIQNAVPDWFDKYVIVIPNTNITKYSNVKKEVDDLLAKSNLTAKSLSIGIFSGSGNNSADIAPTVGNLDLKNLFLMDPFPGSSIIDSTSKAKAKGTNIYMMYNPSNWSDNKGYGGVNNQGGLSGNILQLVNAAGNADKIAYNHMSIPSELLKKYKKQIENSL